MPISIRCKHFTKNGNPIEGGCKNGTSCRYMHPDDKAFWEVVPPRCKFFDHNKKSLMGGCKHKNPSECLYSHPNESEWDGKRRSDPRLNFQARTKASNAQRLQDQVQPPITITTHEDRQLQLTPQIEIDHSKDVITVSTHPTVTGKSPASPPTTPTIITNMPDILDSDATGSSKSGKEELRVWRSRTRLFAHAISKYQNLLEEKRSLDRSISLIDLAPPFAQPELRHNIQSQHSSILKQEQELEGVLSSIYDQLHSMGFWSVPFIVRQNERGYSEILDEIKSYKARVDQVESSMAMKAERRRKKDEMKAALTKKTNLLASQYDGYMKRINNFQNRLQSISSLVEEDKDGFECDRSDWASRTSQLKNTRTVMQDQVSALGHFNSGLDQLSKEIDDLPELSSSIELQREDATNIKTKLISLEASQVDADKQMRQVLQDLDEYIVDVMKPDPVLKSLEDLKAYMFSEVEKCIDQQTISLKEFITTKYSDVQTEVRNQLDPVTSSLNTVFKELANLKS